MEHGHVKINRKAYAEDEFWNEPRVFSRWEAWEDLIQLASWKPRKQLVKAVLVTLDRGQLLASERFLAERWQWSRGKVRRFLDLLCEMERIEIGDHLTDHVGRIVTLCNYDRYQSVQAADGPPTGPVADHRRTTDGPPTDQREGSKSSKGSKGKKTDASDPVDPHFERAWSLYPKRKGGNSKSAAHEAWNARRKDGVDAATLIAAVERYAKYADADGIAGTKFVMQASSFFGPKKRGWEEDWAPPDQNGGADDDDWDAWIEQAQAQMQ